MKYYYHERIIVINKCFALVILQTIWFSFGKYAHLIAFVSSFFSLAMRNFMLKHVIIPLYYSLSHSPFPFFPRNLKSSCSYSSRIQIAFWKKAKHSRALVYRDGVKYMRWKTMFIVLEGKFKELFIPRSTLVRHNYFFIKNKHEIIFVGFLKKNLIYSIFGGWEKNLIQFFFGFSQNLLPTCN